MSLIRNYFTSLFRFSIKDRFYAILNLLGLAIGLGSAILIFLYIQDELSYDKYNEDYKRIYRLESDFVQNDKPEMFALTQIPIGPTLKDEYPEIEEMTRILPLELQNAKLYFRHGEDVFEEDSVAFTDSTIVNIFSLEFLQGDPKTSLTEPLTMVLSQSLADKYFGTTDIVGESLTNLDGTVYRITGVFKDLPKNSHLRYNALISAKTIEEQIGSAQFNDRSAISFWSMQTYTYVKLAENTTAQMVLDKFPGFYDKYMKEVGDLLDASFTLRMTNIGDVHYGDDELDYDLQKGNMNYIFILTVIAVFLIFIAGVNYTNLTTARASQRGKEIGMRKVGGADRATLRTQFIGESLINSTIAGILSIVLILLVLPTFNGLAEKSFDFADIFQLKIILFIIGLVLLTGILSGIYPAFYLSSFNPVAIMKGGSDGLKEKGLLRRVLVVSQFVISAFMIIGTIVVATQLSYIRNKPLGFDKDQIITIQLSDSSILNNIDAYKEELKRSPLIEGAARSMSVPGRIFGKGVMTVETGEGEMAENTVNLVVVDYDFMDVYGIELIDQPNARKFSKEFSSDPASSFIVNEALTREFNQGDESIGKRFRPGVLIDGQGPPEGEIIGVVNDFHFASLHNPIDGVVFIVSDDHPALQTLSVRFAKGKGSEALEWIKETREKFNPIYPIQYSFLEDELDELYRQEKVIYYLFIGFTVLVLIISAIGLLGLSSFMTAKRTKETGIRRVMGATQNQIVTLFISQFSKWVILANIIAWPVAWFLMKKWLENFEFRKEFPYWSFAIALFASLIIAIFTVSWQSIKASRMDPANSIKTE